MSSKGMVVLVSMALVGRVFAAGTTKDLEEIDAVGAAIDAAWNKGDAKVFAATYVEDGTLTIPAGVVLKGRAEIERFFSTQFAGPLKGTTHTHIRTSIHFIRPDVAVGDGTSEVVGIKGPRPTAKAMYTAVYVKVKGRWMYSDVRGYVHVTLPPASRLSVPPPATPRP
jgi:uncharacterized protein (TIGR02246 family)